MKILLAGGGSGGPVAPLIAVAEAIKLKVPKVKFLLVGTKIGPEIHMAKAAGIDFISIPAGKWRRYLSLKNFTAPFATLAGFISAIRLLKSFRPDCVFGAGSFVQVPVMWAAWFLKIPCVMHQQDVAPSLANKLCEPVASKITVSFEKSITDFSQNFGIFYRRKAERVVQTGNPFRAELTQLSKEQGRKILKLKNDLPVLLVLGGGTGSEFINRLVLQALPELVQFTQIVHSFGTRSVKTEPVENYHPYAFIEDMAAAYASADIVLSRAGLSTLAELSALEKISIIIPMPKTHQEFNAFLLDRLKAALVFDQSRVNPKNLVKVVRKLLFDAEFQKDLAKNISKIMPKNSAEKIAKIILETAKNRPN